jgi:hypothetical protein
LVGNACVDKKKNQQMAKDFLRNKFLRPLGTLQRENTYLMQLLRSIWEKPACKGHWEGQIAVKKSVEKNNIRDFQREHFITGSEKEKKIKKR